MVLRRGLLVVLVLMSLVISPTFGQQADEVFGKNRIQYRQFDWLYLSGENFDVYYYDARKAVAQETLEFLEAEFDRITDMIDFPPYFKTKIFVYNSLADLRQSNMGLNKNIYKIGGETEFIKPYVEVAHLGTAQEFKEELLFKTSELMVNEMMFGGSLKDIFQSSVLMNLPDWFVDGASYYVAKGWNAEMDDYIRQLMRTKKAKKATQLTGKEAALVGQSIWNFITEKYGKSSMANILNYTRLTRNEERSIMTTLGISFRQMMAEWRRFYGDMEQTVGQSYIMPDDTLRFTGRHNKTTEFTTVKISPDGRYVAYAENDRGRYIVKVRSLENNKEKTIIAGGSKVIDQRVDYRQPLIAWSDASTLGVIGVKKGEYVFWLYDLSTKTKQPRALERFSNVRSFAFSGNGRLVILSADFEGKSDLFLLSTRRDRVRRLTNDLYDDLDPMFIPNTNRVVFSSNRTNDTLRASTKPDFETLANNYNLFVFDLDSTNVVLKRITNTLSKDITPIAIDENNFYYLSDQRGIVNLFKYNKTTGIYSQTTNYASSIKTYDLNFSTRTLALVMNENQRDNIYISQSFNPEKQIFTPATRRKELQQARGIRDRRKQAEETKTMSVKDLLNSRLKAAQEKAEADSVSKIEEPTVKPDSIKPLTQEKKDVVNTDNYVFEDEEVKQTQPKESFLTRYAKARDKSRITGPFPYQSKFSADNFVTSLVIDPLRAKNLFIPGLGLLLESQMNDMLENYRFLGGLMVPLDLRGGDFYGEFQYLPHYIDFNIRFDRKAVRWESVPDPENGDLVWDFKYTINRLEVGASLPFTDRIRLSVKPFAAFTRSTDLGIAGWPTEPTPEKPLMDYYGGFKSELVYDNSVSTGLNLIEGTRAKISYQTYRGLDDNSLSFSQVSLDFRHYQQLYKEIVFAVRGFAGTFFGNAPKVYLLGGMDNWIGNKTRYTGATADGQKNPLGFTTLNPDILFAEYITSLRGFDYGTLFGNSALLFNAELRVPVVRALANGPIDSNFFRNMQLTAFYDIGTSWSGKPPFSENTSVSYETITQSPFQIDIKNYINPWLYSYGCGMRTMMLGYYVKFDVAWPVIDYEVQNPRFFATLGFDF